MKALHPWDEAAARTGLERWDELCARAGWSNVPADRAVLEALFGASWYCTRYLFYRGREGALQLDLPPPGPLPKTTSADPEQYLEQLRMQRNDCLLRWLAADLRGELSREHLERGLTELAGAVLRALLGTADLETRRHFMVLGLGRLAGNEMNYGSDLDLVFLYPRAAGSSEVTREVILLLRRCASLSPAGRLYEIDTRLRPHGAAGTLVTSLEGFEEYHRAARETWEKQVLCRCRPLHDPEGRAAALLERLRDHLYGSAPGPEQLCTEVRAMRGRVERELGRPAGRHDLKRGVGGIMDIDFIVHYLQLSHGARLPEMRRGGTRHGLKTAADAGIIRQADAEQLLDAYDRLKRIEGSLRLPDLRPVSTFSKHPEQLAAVARAAGCRDGESFLRSYQELTARVRVQYERLLAPSP